MRSCWYPWRGISEQRTKTDFAIKSNYWQKWIYTVYNLIMFFKVQTYKKGSSSHFRGPECTKSVPYACWFIKLTVLEETSISSVKSVASFSKAFAMAVDAFASCCNENKCISIENVSMVHWLIAPKFFGTRLGHDFIPFFGYHGKRFWSSGGTPLPVYIPSTPLSHLCLFSHVVSGTICLDVGCIVKPAVIVPENIGWGIVINMKWGLEG